MITVTNLAFSYSENSKFNFPDFTCSTSQVLLITGNSGVGKTTLLHLLGGLLESHLGEINFDGLNINQLSSKQKDTFRGKNIGIILQQNHFIESLSVLENVVIGSYIGSGKKDKQRATDLLSQLGLENHLHKYPSQLSIGQQQRVSIARALINQPKVILADEPTSSLDDENAILVANLLEKLAKEFQTALIIVTHDSRLKSRFTNQIQLT